MDASLIAADANKQRSVPATSGAPTRLDAGRAAREYLATLDEAAFGAASEVTPKFISRSDPAAQWTGAHKGHAFFAYATNYLIDTENAVILDVEATRAIRQAEVGAARTMLDRTARALRPEARAPGRRQRLRIGGRISPGWSRSGRSSRISRCSTSRTEPMARSRGPTSSSIRSATVTPARRARCWCSSDAATPLPEPASPGRDTALSRQQVAIAMSAN